MKRKERPSSTRTGFWWAPISIQPNGDSLSSGLKTEWRGKSQSDEDGPHPGRVVEGKSILGISPSRRYQWEDWTPVEPPLICNILSIYAPVLRTPYLHWRWRSMPPWVLCCACVWRWGQRFQLVHLSPLKSRLGGCVVKVKPECLGPIVA